VVRDAAVAVKVVEVDPTAIVMVEGTLTILAGLVDSVRRVPPVGTALESVIVQVVDVADVNVVLVQAMELRVTVAATLKLAVWLAPFNVAVTVEV